MIRTRKPTTSKAASSVAGSKGGKKKKITEVKPKWPVSAEPVKKAESGSKALSPKPCSKSVMTVSESPAGVRTAEDSNAGRTSAKERSPG